MMSGGRPLTMDTADPDTDSFGAGRIEDFSWKAWLDFTTCTECGRCQSQCPAWNTGKPLSPKLLIMSLRDHGYAKAPYLLAGGRTDMGGDEVGLVDADGNELAAKLEAIPAAARAEAQRPLVGEAAGVGAGAVIDTETLWSCTNCGACVEQCPVDIEHVDHIVDGAAHTPEDQLSAVREVLSSLGVAEHPEIVVLNKADVADPAVVARMRHLVPGLVVVSAKTGEGFEDLRAAIDAALPQPPVTVDILVPYGRGDLLARVHAEGEVTFLEHTDTGTHVVAAVPADLADRLTGPAEASDSTGV